MKRAFLRAFPYTKPSQLGTGRPQMTQEVPTLTPDGHVLFTSSAVLAGAMPALKSGTLVVRAPGLSRGLNLTVQLMGGGMHGKVSTRATVVSEMGDQVLLHLLDLTPQLIANALQPTREMPAVGRPPVVTDEALQSARTMLAEAAERMARITHAMSEPGHHVSDDTVTTGGQPIMIRTPISTPVVTTETGARVFVHPSGHIEFESALDLASRLERITQHGSLSAEWAGSESPSWMARVFFLHARRHPAVVDVMGELVPVSGKRCTLIFRDRQELACVALGLKQALVMRGPHVDTVAQIARLTPDRVVEFESVESVMSVLPMLYAVGKLRVRWAGGALPSGVVELQMALPPLPERGVLFATVVEARDGLATVTLDAREDARVALNTWLGQVRRSTVPRMAAVDVK